MEMIDITARVSRGKQIGTIVRPHLYKGGYYVVAKGGNTIAFSKRVRGLPELLDYVKLGYGVRMSGTGVAPSIYMPQSINIDGA
jgi:hypothetical protein